MLSRMDSLGAVLGVFRRLLCVVGLVNSAYVLHVSGALATAAILPAIAYLGLTAWAVWRPSPGADALLYLAIACACALVILTLIFVGARAFYFVTVYGAICLGPSIVGTSILRFQRKRERSIEGRCPVCRRSLNGIQGGCCPECGQDVRLSS